MRSWLRKIILLASLLALAALWFLREVRTSHDETPPESRPAASNFLNLAPTVKYVGDEDCALCHSEIFKSFAQTGMGRSFYTPAAIPLAAEVTGNTRVYAAASNFYYEVALHEGQLRQTEYRLAADGKRTHELSRTANYVIGSGNHARTYLTSESGFIYEMPLTWYTQKKTWGLSPGYAYVNSRFSRPVVAGCMNCHNSYADYVPYSGNRYGEVPHGIGCERCHGPGELHVAKQYQTKFEDSTRTGVDFTIVNPRHLPPALQMDVCYQCHLQGEVRILKEGKDENDFRPGMRLQEVRSIYVLKDSPPGDFRVASHGERLALSACFKQSDGRLVCITCHNPHQAVRVTPRDSFNAACGKCHDAVRLSARAEHQAESDCVACHMPQGNTSDVVHVNFTDHWIQRKPFAAQPPRADTTIALREFFAETDDAAELRLGIAYLRYYEIARKREAYFQQALALLQTGVEKNPEHQAGRYHLGLAYAYQNNLSAAEREFRALSKREPQDALVFFEWAKTLNRMGRAQDAITAYQNALRLWPDNAPALTQLGGLYLQQEQVMRAREYFERALVAQPSYTPGHNALGELAAQKHNDLATAKRHFLRALHYDPDDIQTLNNLGASALAEGKYEESVDYFTQVLARDPRFLPAYGSLAFVYSLQRDYATAQKYLRRALEIAPDDARLKSMLTQISQTE